MECNIIIDFEVVEWDYGVYEGMFFKDIKKEVFNWSIWDDGLVIYLYFFFYIYLFIFILNLVVCLVRFLGNFLYKCLFGLIVLLLKFEFFM